MMYAFLIFAAYLLGSIPFGFILVKVLGRGDIRSVSSGNIGATNVARVIGLPGFVTTFVLDMAKIIAPVLVGISVGGVSFGALCGAVAIIGNMFPVWLGFRGGKGVSSLFGFMVALNPIMFAVQGIIWLIIGLTTGYSSLAAWVNWILLPVFGFAVDFWTGVICLPLALLGLWAQRENIKRFIAGNESKMQMNPKKLALALIGVGLLAIGVIAIIYYV